MLNPQAQLIFDLVDALMFIFRVKDGHIRKANENAKARLGDWCEGGFLGDIIGSSDSERVLKLLDDSHVRHAGFVSLSREHGATAFGFDIAPFPDEEEDLAILILKELSAPAEHGARTPHGNMVRFIGEVTNRIMHDVRNLIFPLVGHVELAMASLDSNADVYASLLDVQSACRNCEEDLSKLLEMAQHPPSPRRFVHPVDLMERSAMVLGYTLPKHVPIEVDVHPSTPLIEISLADCQQRIVDLAALAFQQRGAFRRVLLGAEDNSSGGVTCEIHIETEQTLDEAALRSELELTRAFLNSLLIDSNLKGRATSTEDSLTFFLDVDASAISHAALPDGSSEDKVKGSESVLVFHRNAMMRDIIGNHLEDKGYTVTVCAEPDDLRALSQAQTPPFALFADLSEGDDELSNALQDVLTTDRAHLVILACQEEDTLDHPRVRVMPRSYRLDAIPSLLRQSFDLND